MNHTLIAFLAGGFLGYGVGYTYARNELQARIMQLEAEIFRLREQVRILSAENRELWRQMQQILKTLQEIVAFLKSLRDSMQVKPPPPRVNSYR